MPLLSLDCLTVTNATPEETVFAAAAAGFDIVSLWTGTPVHPRQQVNGQNRDAVRAALARTGIGVHTIEVFDLTSDEAVDGYRPALELGAELGGRTAVAINYANPDRVDVARLLQRFAALAGEYGLAVNVEPIIVGHTRTLAEGAALIAQAGVDAGLVFDFLHLVRSGGNAHDVRNIDPSLIRYVQVCDGEAHMPDEDIPVEASFSRMMPGTGAFPIAELLAATPPSAIIAVESPDLARFEAGGTAAQFAQEAMAALRPFLQQATV